MKNLYIILILSLSLNSAMITGSQDKLSISGGNMNVTSAGVTKTVNSGEITFTKKGQAPSDARKLKKDDLKDITDDLKMTTESRPINMSFAPTKKIIAKNIASFLQKAGIPKNKIEQKEEDGKISLYIKQIDINLIKGIYPIYYKAVSKYYQKYKQRLKSKKNTPTIKVKLNMMKKYHRSIFKKYK